MFKTLSDCDHLFHAFSTSGNVVLIPRFVHPPSLIFGENLEIPRTKDVLRTEFIQANYWFESS